MGVSWMRWLLVMWLCCCAAAAYGAQKQSPAPGDMPVAVDPRHELIHRLQVQLGIKDGKLPSQRVHHVPSINYFNGSWSRVKITRRLNQALELVGDFWQTHRLMLRLIVAAFPLGLMLLVAFAAYELRARRLAGFMAGFAINAALTAVILELVLYIFLGFMARQSLWPPADYVLLVFPLYWLLATTVPAKLMLGWDADLAVIPKFLIGLLLPLTFLAVLFLPDFFARYRTGSLWVIGIACGVAIIGLIVSIKVGARRMA